MERFDRILLIKVGLILFCLCFIKMLPTNEEVKDLGKQLNDLESSSDDEEEQEALLADDRQLCHSPGL